MPSRVSGSALLIAACAACGAATLKPPIAVSRERAAVQFAHAGGPGAAPIAESAVVTMRNGLRDDRCLVRRGCDRAPIALSRCGFFATGRDWSDIMLEAEWLNGQKVSVKGALGVGAIVSTLKDCDGRCCNESAGPVVVAGDADVVGLQGLVCLGDESEVCCNAPAYGQMVIATGRLATQNRYPSAGAWTLEDPEICVLSP